MAVAFLDDGAGGLLLGHWLDQLELAECCRRVDVTQRSEKLELNLELDS